MDKRSNPVRFRAGGLLELEQMLQHLPCYVYWKDLNGAYLGCNEQIAKDAGFSSCREVVGKLDKDMPWKEYVEDIIANDQLVITLRKTNYFQEPIRIVDGTLLNLLVIKSPILNEDDDVIGVFCIAVDANNRRETNHILSSKQENLQYDEKRFFEISRSIVGRNFSNSHQDKFINDIVNYYENIISQVPCNLYWMDRNLTYLGCSDRTAKLLRLKSRLDVVGMSYPEMAKLAHWSQGQSESFMRDDLDVLQSGNPKINVEEPPVPGKDGGLIYYLTTRVPLKDKNDNVVGVLGVSIDITDRKLAEAALVEAKREAEEANRAKSEFLAMMTHELRTPLNVIMGMVQIMQKDTCTEEQRQEYFNTIMRSSKSLLGLINDILDFSKAQSGKLQVIPEPFELQPLLSQLYTEFNVKGQQHGTQFVIKKDEKLPNYLVADELRLRQVIYNLCDNAMKFTSQGSVTLRLDQFESKKTGFVGLKVQIIDTGIGIPQDKLETVFEQFTQVSSAKHTEYSRKYGGVGLGLAIVRHLVNLMDGRIKVDSELGKGATFTCEFEFALPNDEQMDLIKEQSKKRTENLEKALVYRKVLVVEDNLLNQKVVCRMLESLNCEVDIANDGSEALAKMQRPYDVVLMDMSLPDLSGIEVTKQFRKTEPRDQHQLIIALSANVHSDDQQRCMLAGMDGFLPKPLMFEELRELIASL